MQLIFGILVASLGLSILPAQAQNINGQEKALQKATLTSGSKNFGQVTTANTLIAQSSRTVKRKPVILPLPLPATITEPTTETEATPQKPSNAAKPNPSSSNQVAQVADAQVAALVEALRLASPKTGKENDGLYSDWQVMPSNIPRWSKQCTGKELTPKEFEANPTRARQILTCVMRDVFQDEYRTSNSNESVAVQRAAAWWMTGDASKYNSNDTGPYTKKVLAFYQQLRENKPVAATVVSKPVTSKPVISTPVISTPVTSKPVISKPVTPRQTIPALMPHI